MRKTILITLVALLALTAAAAAKTPRYYVPKAHHACRASYKRTVVKVRERRHGKLVRRHHKIVMVKQTRCVFVAPKKTTPAKPSPPAPAAKVTYTARVDPSFTQDPRNPLFVTFSYSADATRQVGAQVTDLASAGALPDGILQLYVSTTPGEPEGLACSMNVGGAVTGGSCPLILPRTGSYSATTAYITSATNSVTDTETTVIEPYGTDTSLTSTASSGKTLYGLSVVDDHGNPVTVGDVGRLTVTDASTGTTLGSFPYDTSDVPQSFHIAIRNVGGTGELFIFDDRGNYVGPVTPADQFAIQASYTPRAGTGWTASTSTVLPLTLSP